MQLIKPTPQALVDVLASDTRIHSEDDDGELDFKGIILLCSQWHVDPVVRYPVDGSRWYYDWIATIRRLAAHVMNQGKE